MTAQRERLHKAERDARRGAALLRAESRDRAGQEGEGNEYQHDGCGGKRVLQNTRRLQVVFSADGCGAYRRDADPDAAEDQPRDGRAVQLDRDRGVDSDSGNIIGGIGDLHGMQSEEHQRERDEDEVRYRGDGVCRLFGGSRKVAYVTDECDDEQHGNGNDRGGGDERTAYRLNIQRSSIEVARAERRIERVLEIPIDVAEVIVQIDALYAEGLRKRAPFGGTADAEYKDHGAKRGKERARAAGICKRFLPQRGGSFVLPLVGCLFGLRLERLRGRSLRDRRFFGERGGLGREPRTAVNAECAVGGGFLPADRADEHSVHGFSAMLAEYGGIGILRSAEFTIHFHISPFVVYFIVARKTFIVNKFIH